MLESVLAYINNWFIVGRIRGEFVIEGGALVSELPEGFLAEGQYFRIVGSVFNNGLHLYATGENSTPTANTDTTGDTGGVNETDLTTLTDETFTGCIYSLAIPALLISLSKEISEWCEKYQAQTQTPYTSESFGGYSYSKADGGSTPTWQHTFSKQLNRWRKL